jgi:P2-related tail formation protein
MTMADRQTVEAFARLENNADFRQVMKWLANSAESERRVMLHTADTAELHRIRGTMLVLHEITEIAGKAQKIIDAERNTRQDRTPDGGKG